MAVKTAVLTGFGINADAELEKAFKHAGSEVDSLHINTVIKEPAVLQSYAIAAFPGGFSFGDHLGSGKVLAHMCRKHLKSQLESFVKKGGLIIGICNGFQVLVKMGILPNLDGAWQQDVSLIHNVSGVFEDRWVNLSFPKTASCIWTKNLSDTEMPIRNGEGRFIVKNDSVLKELHNRSLIAVTYKGQNPNGSVEDIAGITDPTGQILGLMPHPEAYLYSGNHPWHHRPEYKSENKSADGLGMFRNAVRHAESAVIV